MPLIPMAPPSGPPAGPPGAGPDPRALLAALGGLGGPGGPPGGGPHAPDPLDALQQVIQDIHALIAVLPGGQETQTASQCLAALTRIQATMMQTQQTAGDASQALQQRLGGGAGMGA